LWTDAFLQQARGVGDPLGDETIRTVFDRGDASALHTFMGQLVANDEMPANLPPEIAAFLAATSTLPPWSDPAKIQMAERLFLEHGLVSMMALVFASLPECYVMKHGVKILALTRQLGEHTNRRVHQTASMVLGVMNAGGLSPTGRGIRQTQKVRLIHATIRYQMLKRAAAAPASAAPMSVTDVVAGQGISWDLNDDGWPINQEDLAYTLLTFSYVIPMAMRRLGVTLTDEEFEAFLHAWNVTGHILGVRADLMAHTVEDATALFDAIKARQAGASAGAAMLTNAMLDLVNEKLLRLPILHPLGPIAMRVLVGDTTAAMLGLNERDTWAVVLMHRLIASIIKAIDAVAIAFGGFFRPFRWLAPWLGQRIIVLLCDITARNGQPQPDVPPGWLTSRTR